MLATLPDVGTEPYGVAAAPNGAWFAVTCFRSATVVFYDAATLSKMLEHVYDADFDFIPIGKTIADLDSNQDGLPDVGEPRGFTIHADSTKIYVTHHRSPFVSVLDLTLDGKKEIFTGSHADAANPMLTREYRKPFVVPAEKDV